MIFGHEDANKHVNVTIIVGIHPEKTVHSLILCRFWKAITHPPSKPTVNRLLLNLIGMTESNNIEKKRTGGSSGTATNISQAYYKLMSQPGTCPRNRRGAFIIPHGTSVTVAYMNAEGITSMFTYSNPVDGGESNKYPNLY